MDQVERSSHDFSLESLGVSNEVVVLVADIVMQKKELASVDRQFVMKELREFLKRDPKALRYLKKGVSDGVNIRNSDFKRIVKSVRSNLRRYHGLFSEGNRDYGELVSRFDEVQDFDSLNIVARELLAVHTSSKERLKEYKFVWQEIWRVFGLDSLKNVRIGDFGCGFNPMSLVYLSEEKLAKVAFYSYDINVSEKDVLNRFYDVLGNVVSGFSGKSDVLDLLDFDSVSRLDQVDVALLFKVTDHLDKGKGHKKTEQLIESLNTRFMVLSFPTVTRTGAPMKYPRRKWVEIMSERLGYSWQKFETSNELFYLIIKN